MASAHHAAANRALLELNIMPRASDNTGRPSTRQLRLAEGNGKGNRPMPRQIAVRVRVRARALRGGNGCLLWRAPSFGPWSYSGLRSADGRAQSQPGVRTAPAHRFESECHELQADLDAWLVEYNERRSHQGRWCYGKNPMQTFLDALPLAKEKLMAA